MPNNVLGPCLLSKAAQFILISDNCTAFSTSRKSLIQLNSVVKMLFNSRSNLPSTEKKPKKKRQQNTYIHVIQ